MLSQNLEEQGQCVVKTATFLPDDDGYSSEILFFQGKDIQLSVLLIERRNHK